MTNKNLREAKSTMVPVVDHPHGIRLCSLAKARDVHREGRGSFVEGVLYWRRLDIRRRDTGYYGPTKGELRIKPSDGYVVVQLEQGNAKLD